MLMERKKICLVNMQIILIFVAINKVFRIHTTYRDWKKRKNKNESIYRNLCRSTKHINC